MTLGYIYFELSEFDAASKFLLEIEEPFYDFPKVLLTLSWTFVKKQDYQSALTHLNKLVAEYSDFDDLDEAHFLRGQCYLKLGYYDFAVDEFDLAVGAGAAQDSVADIEVARRGLDEQQQRIEHLEQELHTEEAKLMAVTPLPSVVDAHPQLPDDPAKIQNDRTILVERVMSGREEYDQVSESIAALRGRIDRLERRKRWEAYAEYGRVKALYLKGVGAE